MRDDENTEFDRSQLEPEVRVIQPQWTDRVDVLEPVVTAVEVDDPAWKVTAGKKGAKREGFFRSRDYGR